MLKARTCHPTYSRSLNSKNAIMPKRNFGDYSHYVDTMTNVAKYSTGLATLGTAAFAVACIYRYKVANPDQYIAKTGILIDDISIHKRTFIWPLQKYKYISMHPKNYEISLNSMSSEKVNFKLPGVFTIGPENTPEALIKYVRTIESLDDKNDKKGHNNMESIILGILEGQTRNLSSTMTIEEIFNSRQAFKEKIIQHIQEEMDKVGLCVYQASLRELTDDEGSKYFYNMRQRRLAEAENEAKVAIAENKMKGDTGAKMKEAQTRQLVAQFESETVQKENERQQEIEKSIADLEVVKAEAFRKKEIAKTEAINAAQQKQAELEKDVEEKKIGTETNRTRVDKLSKAQVQAEIAFKDAEGIANALRTKADAELYAKQKESEGIKAIYDAQSQGVTKLLGSFGQDHTALLKYLFVDKGLYPRLAQINAEAIRDLKPKINIWSTTSDGKSSDYTKTISDVLKMVPPLYDSIHQQTGMTPTEWIMNKKPVDENQDKN
jgi:flotillin